MFEVTARTQHKHRVAYMPHTKTSRTNLQKKTRPGRFTNLPTFTKRRLVIWFPLNTARRTQTRQQTKHCKNKKKQKQNLALLRSFGCMPRHSMPVKRAFLVPVNFLSAAEETASTQTLAILLPLAFQPECQIAAKRESHISWPQSLHNELFW